MRNYLFTTERLGLRRWVAGDEAVFIQMNRDPSVMEFFPRTMEPAETLAMVGRIHAFFAANGFGLYAADLLSTGEFLGFTGFTRPSFESWFTPCVEIGWRLKKEAWGRGYATEAAKACLRYGFQEIGLETIYSFTAVLNTRSERVMQKIGMQRAGEFDHPALGQGHALKRHVLYVAKAPPGTGPESEFLQRVRP
jgi:RimJ/RimL family protein N-acetyltransferase